MSSIYKITSIQNDKLEKYKHKAMKELNEFFDMEWLYCTPIIIVVEDRNTINNIRGEDTNRSIVGWCWGNMVIFVLNPDNFGTESSHKYNDKEFERFIKHELCHAYFYPIWGPSYFKWLGEGLSIYTAGQLVKYPMPNKFEGFLDPKNRKKVFSESGGAIKLLIDTFGKNRLFEFFEAQRGIKDPDKLSCIFENVFEKKLNYELFNTLRGQ